MENLSQTIKNLLLEEIDKKIAPEQNIPLLHCGLYFGLSVNETEILNVGSLFKQRDNLKDSIKEILKEASTKSTKLDRVAISGANASLEIVTKITYLPDPLRWNPLTAGVCLTWGQNHKGCLLPYEIKALNRMNKKNHQTEDLLDRLATWKCNLPSNIWRLPTGLVWSLDCTSYSL
jgi:hypothetical protein